MHLLQGLNSARRWQQSTQTIVCTTKKIDFLDHLFKSSLKCITDSTVFFCPLSCGHSCGGSEKGISPSAVKYSPRSRIHSSTRSPIGVRRTSSRELVSFGRHKLRRLSTTFSRTSKEHTHTHTTDDSTMEYRCLLCSVHEEQFLTNEQLTTTCLSLQNNTT